MLRSGAALGWDLVTSRGLLCRAPPLPNSPILGFTKPLVMPRFSAATVSPLTTRRMVNSDDKVCVTKGRSRSRTWGRGVKDVSVPWPVTLLQPSGGGRMGAWNRVCAPPQGQLGGCRAEDTARRAGRCRSVPLTSWPPGQSKHGLRKAGGVWGRAGPRSPTWVVLTPDR